MNLNCFRAYDIRGVFNEDLSLNDFKNIARAFAIAIKQELNKENITLSLCRDGRLSSPEIYDVIKEVLLKDGINIISAGLGHSPLGYFSVYHQNTDGLIMITASHNPKEYNGIKFMCGKEIFHGKQIKNLIPLLNYHPREGGDLIYQTKKDSRFRGNDRGLYTNKSKEISTAYIERLLQDLTENISDLKIIWDCGNGSTGEIIETLTKQLPNKNINLYTDINGNFPNHHPDPTQPKNLITLSKNIIKNNFDIGIAFDGDGDRIGIIDDEGKHIGSDLLLAILSREILENNKNAKIIADVKCSNELFDYINTNGGKAIMCATGHSLVKTKLKQENGQLAGEASGHIFYNDKYYGYDDAIYTAIRLLNILIKDGRKLSEIKRDFKTTYKSPEIRIKCNEKDKFKIVNEIKEKALLENLNVLDIDGIRAETEKGWWLIRASNTESALSINYEAYDIESFNQLKEKINFYLNDYNIKL